MSTPAPPQWIDGVELTGLALRLAAAMLVASDGTTLGGRPGVVPGSGALAVAVSGTTITVSPGGGWLASPGQGVYQAVLPTARTLTLNAAHATLTRIDLVYLRVWDNAVDGSGLNQADAVYLAGTASSAPTAPTPSGTQIYIPLATINVPSVSAGGAPSVSQAVRPFTVAPGGILPAPAAPGAPYVGEYWDNGSDLQRWNGSGWDLYQKVQTVAWTTPTLASGSPAGYSGDGNSNGTPAYRIVTDYGTQFVEWSGGLNVPYSGGVPVNSGNFLAAPMPAAARPTKLRTVPAACSAVASDSLSVKIDFKPDGSTAIVTQTGVQPPWVSLNGLKYRLA